MLKKIFSGITKPPSYEDVRQAQVFCPSLKSRTLAQVKTRAWLLCGNQAKTLGKMSGKN